MSNRSFITAFGLGSALMYFFDPGRGKRRRALVRDRAAQIVRRASRFADKAIRDVANRTQGLAAEADAIFSDEPVPEEILRARIETRLGRLVAHPHQIQVSVSGGRVTLEGTAVAHELPPMIAAVSAMRGVSTVISRLHPYGTPFAESITQSETWNPAARLAAGVAGGIATATGLWLFGNRGVLAAMLTMSGTGLLARSVTNQRLTEITGLAARDNPASSRPSAVRRQ